MFSTLVSFARIAALASASVVGLAYAMTAAEDTSVPVVPETLVEVSKPTIIAFAGDHGTKPASRAVFELIAREGADLLVSQGDLGYDATPEEFERLIDETLGPDFPIVAALGNHDWSDRGTYSAMLGQRLTRLPGLKCEGTPGLESTCSFRGIEIVSVTPACPACACRGAKVATWSRR